MDNGHNYTHEPIRGIELSERSFKEKRITHEKILNEPHEDCQLIC
jgi:hypothetical protein